MNGWRFCCLFCMNVCQSGLESDKEVPHKVELSTRLRDELEMQISAVKLHRKTISSSKALMKNTSELQIRRGKHRNLHGHLFGLLLLSSNTFHEKTCFYLGRRFLLIKYYYLNFHLITTPCGQENELKWARLI